jgi:hypothetical protein
MHKSATKCNETLSKWCKNKHGASKIMDTLETYHPSLYNIVQRKNVLVANVLAHSLLNIEFKRALNGNKWNEWLHLYKRIMTVNLSNQPDRFVWKVY